MIPEGRVLVRQMVAIIDRALARHVVAEVAARVEVRQERDMVLEMEDIKKGERKEYRALARRVLT